MRQSKAALAVIAVLVAAVSLPVLARDGSGRGSGSGRSGASGHSHRAAPGGHAPRAHAPRAHAPRAHAPRAHAPGGHAPHVHAPRRGFAGPHIGFFLGAPLYAPIYYTPAPIYYTPPPVPVYIEKAPAAPDTQRAPAAPDSVNWGYWYLCPQSGIYYPYVQECPGGWQQVVPQPPEGALNSPG